MVSGFAIAYRALKKDISLSVGHACPTGRQAAFNVKRESDFDPSVEKITVAVKAHGGALTVETKENEGTEFEVQLTL